VDCRSVSGAFQENCHLGSLETAWPDFAAPCSRINRFFGVDFLGRQAMAGWLKNTAVSGLRLTAITLLILIGAQLLVHLDVMDWGKMEYVPYILGVYAAIEMLVVVVRSSARPRNEDLDHR
jgi:hypothetical protein